MLVPVELCRLFLLRRYDIKRPCTLYAFECDTEMSHFHYLSEIGFINSLHYTLPVTLQKENKLNEASTLDIHQQDVFHTVCFQVIL